MASPAALDRAADQIETSFRSTLLPVERQSFAADGKTCHNLVLERPGTGRKDEIVVIGAHYDSAESVPGADDNASGVAVLLELARLTSGPSPQARTVRFVAFANEEPPYFQSPSMGSLVYARRCRDKGERIVAMLSLESLGYFRDEPGTQRYPPLFSALYPDRGNFVAFVGDLGSRWLVRRAIGTFRKGARIASEGGALPGGVPGVGWSDQWAFWEAGYPGIMVTDTAPFRNPNYHTPGDTPETLDYVRLARVVLGLVPVVRDLTSKNTE